MLNKSIVRALKGHIPALVLSELVARDAQFQESPAREDGDWFYFQVERLEAELMIGRDARRSALKILVDFGILQIERKGVPSKYYYKINYEKIDELISQNPKPLPTSKVDPPLTGEVESTPTSKAETLPTYIKNKEKEIKEIPNSTTQGKKDTFHEDPYIRRYDSEKTEMVFGVINDFFIKEYKTRCRPDKPYTMEIVSIMLAETEEEIKEEVSEKILQFLYHPWWSIEKGFRPTPKHLFKAWEALDPNHVPEYRRKGFSDIKEYHEKEFDVGHDLRDDIVIELPDAKQIEKNKEQVFKSLGGTKNNGNR